MTVARRGQIEVRAHEIAELGAGDNIYSADGQEHWRGRQPMGRLALGSPGEESAGPSSAPGRCDQDTKATCVSPKPPTTASQFNAVSTPPTSANRHCAHRASVTGFLSTRSSADPRADAHSGWVVAGGGRDGC
jgi:hypothetical protein